MRIPQQLIDLGFELVCENSNSTIQVYKRVSWDDSSTFSMPSADYSVVREGLERHPHIDAEGVMRVLCTYLNEKS